jgi:hypothetical protein
MHKYANTLVDTFNTLILCKTVAKAAASKIENMLADE